MAEHSQLRTPLSQFIGPRYWPTWLALAGMWVAAHLPYALQIRLGQGLGLLSYYFARSRRHICEVNLRLCFPELSPEEHRRLVRKTFLSNGIGLIEVAISWFRDPEDYRSRTRVTGLENLESAIAGGKGVLLLCAHFSSLEMGGFLFNLVGDMDITYRPNKNPLFQAAMFNGRIRHFRHVYDRKDVRGAMRTLKAGRILWYAPDQDYGAKHSVFVPFFGVEAATITATARFAKVNDSAVLFFSHYRNEDNSGYHLDFSPALENFPSGDAHADASTTNALIEQAIRSSPINTFGCTSDSRHRLPAALRDRIEPLEMRVEMKLDWRQLDIRWLAVAASLLLSVLTLLLQEVPNSDAYTYARTAEIFLESGITAAYQHYSWATYSVLIGIVSGLGLDVFSAGLLVNAAFYAILVYAYLSIVREIDDSRSLLTLSAICILVYPQLNEYRELLIRDLGFWALSLLALWQYLLYAKTQSLRCALFFCAALLLAASFRAEALAYLALTPLALLFDTRIEPAARRILLGRMYGLAISLAAGLLLFLALMGLNVAELFFEFASIYEPFVSGNFTLNDDERALLGSLLFADYAATFSREYIEIFLLAGMIAILLANLFTALGGPYLIILFVGLVKKQIRLPRGIKVPVLFYLVINLIILLGFLLLTRYLSSRYAMLMCILLALFVPITLHHLLETARQANRNSMRYMVAIFLSYCAIDSYYSFGESKAYVKDSIEWLAENTADTAGLLTNNHAIAYFSGRVEDYDLVMRNLSAEEILMSDVGDTIAAELTYETERLLETPSIADKLRLLASFPATGERRIAFFERIE